MKIPEIVPISDLRQDAASVFKKLQKSRDPLVVTQRGRAVAVIQSIEAYEKSEYERELLKVLVQGEKEIEEGEGNTAANVFKKANTIIKGEKK